MHKPINLKDVRVKAKVYFGFFRSIFVSVHMMRVSTRGGETICTVTETAVTVVVVTAAEAASL